MKRIFITVLFLTTYLHVFSQIWQSTTFIDGGSASGMIKGLNHRMIVSAGFSIIYYTNDLGVTWKYGLGNLTAHKFINLNGTFYAAGNTGFYKSINNGTDWSLLKGNAVLSDMANYNNQIWLLDDRTSFLYKTNDGINYDSVLTPVPHYDGYQLLISPTGKILLNGMSGINFISTDNGSTFDTLKNFTGALIFMYDKNGVLYGAKNSGKLFSSVNDGGNWQSLNTGLDSTHRVSCMFEDNSGNILFGYDGGLAMSTDKGFTWNDITSNLCETAFPRPYCIGQNDQNYYFVGCDLHIYRSKDTQIIAGVPLVENQGSFAIYPNPADNYCVLKTSNTYSKGVVKVYNLQGALLLTKSAELKNGFMTLNTEKFSTGIYMVELLIDDKILFSKLIKS